MALHIGRLSCGYGLDCVEKTAHRVSSGERDKWTLSGVIIPARATAIAGADDLSKAQYLAHELRAMVAHGEYVPIVWDADPSASGYYLPLDVSIDDIRIVPGLPLIQFAFTAERLGGTELQHQAVLGCLMRPNYRSGLPALLRRDWQEGGFWSPSGRVIGGAETRGEVGDPNAGVNTEQWIRRIATCDGPREIKIFGAYYLAQDQTMRYFADPKSRYWGAATVWTGGRPNTEGADPAPVGTGLLRTGTAVPSDQSRGGIALSNGIVEVVTAQLAPGNPQPQRGGFALRRWTGGGWTSWRFFWPMFRDQFLDGQPLNVAISRNSPSRSTATVAFSQHFDAVRTIRVEAELSLRRGSRTVWLRTVTPEAGRHGLQLDSAISDPGNLCWHSKRSTVVDGYRVHMTGTRDIEWNPAGWGRYAGVTSLNWGVGQYLESQAGDQYEGVRRAEADYLSVITDHEVPVIESGPR